VSFLKRLFGSTDAVEDARARAGKEEGSAAAPAGWNVTSPEVTQTDDEVILKMDALGLDPASLESEVDGDALVLKAHGTTDTGSKVSLNERLKLQGAGDLSRADVSYEDGKLVIRLPKSRQSSA